MVTTPNKAHTRSDRDEELRHDKMLRRIQLAPLQAWSELDASEHLVQFYETDEFLLDSVSGFIGAGLGAGAACIVIATKAISGRGTPLRGGLPSGHAAIAFAGWMAATYVLSDNEHRFLISTLTFIMALLVAQTRVESGVHSTLEVTYGGLLGALVTLALFRVFS